MPVTWEIRNSILLVTLAGDYGFDEPMSAVAQAMADPGFRKGTPLLIDARLSTSRRSSEDFRQRSLWMASLQAKGLASRCAVVINGQLHQLGMARMAATHLDLRGMELEIFTDLNEAVRWLSEATPASQTLEDLPERNDKKAANG
jgi:hypothetical protein